jgi:hypothetical protein
VYRKGSDDIVVRGEHTHEVYRGDRTASALTAFIDKVVLAANEPDNRMAETRRMTLGEGCMVCQHVIYACHNSQYSLMFAAQQACHCPSGAYYASIAFFDWD